MRIAYLGWGSLIWDPRNLRTECGWKKDGPPLPIEFARISRDGRLTLVICPEGTEGKNVPTLWTYSAKTDLQAARDNLRCREGTQKIGYISLSEGRECSRLSEKYAELLEVIRSWAREKELDAVIWTDLDANWICPPNKYRNKVKQPFNADNVIGYLKRLKEAELRYAEEYIRFAPQQIETPIRSKIEHHLKWYFVPEGERCDFTPRGILKNPAGPGPSAETGQGDVRDRLEAILLEASGVLDELLRDEELKGAVLRAAEVITEALRSGGKVLLCGNGGSAADCQHVAGELVGRFKRERRGLPALALTTDTSVLTAVGNDYGFEQVFRRQVEALGRPGDVLIAYSTSGAARNVLLAVEEAKRLGMKTIGMTGKPGGELAGAAEVAIMTPGGSTARIQECHELVGHAVCELVEEMLA